MVWAQVGSLAAPAGEDGKSVELRQNGSVLEWRKGTEPWEILLPLSAITGPAGTSVSIAGSVPTVGSLPSGLTAADNGDGYITSDNGHLHVWDGDSFNDVGSVRGPQGDPGADAAPAKEIGLQVTATHVQWRLGTGSWANLITLAELKGDKGDDGRRGTQWHFGVGAPPADVPDSAPGDVYLDTVTQTYYRLA